MVDLQRVMYCLIFQKTVCDKIIRTNIPKSCNKAEEQEGCRIENITCEDVCFTSECGKKRTECEDKTVIIPQEGTKRECKSETVMDCTPTQTYTNPGHKSKGFKSKGFKSKGFRSIQGEIKGDLNLEDRSQLTFPVRKGIEKRSAETNGHSWKGQYRKGRGHSWKGHWKAKGDHGVGSNCVQKQVWTCKDVPTTIECTESDLEIKYPTECPLPEEMPTECVSNCWSPGVHDIDCPTGKLCLELL